MPKYVVRYGTMRHLGVFTCRARDRYARGQQIIARTPRGQEQGEVLCEATDHVLEQMEGNRSANTRAGQILRLATADDDLEMRRMESEHDEQHALCRQRITESGLDMQLVDVEHLYGGERVVIYYLAEKRVDFRELVKTLAKDLRTRVEMRQIGVRDEAKLLADYGDCGKPVCCNTHLSEMPPVSMKMAKLQRATLDPTKISGRCGRLKCCLRYEYDTYQELRRELPRIGAQVLTQQGRAKVLSQEILTGELLVETEESRRIVIQASEVLTELASEPAPPARQESPAEPKEDRPGNSDKQVDNSQDEAEAAADLSQQEKRPPKKRRRPRRRGGKAGEGGDSSPGESGNG